ncbi:MAG: hypothetical protein U9M92_01360 [Patescibacteria group bacterium]|nr:hypothetical protein [Patescibacteria group bacterium]
MLNLFPDLLTYGFFAPAFLRLVLGLSFIYFGYRTLGSKAPAAESSAIYKILGLIEFLAGLMILFGTWTQGAALVLIVLLLLNLFGFLKNLLPVTAPALAYQLLVLGALLSLLLTGAGAFAFDIPL